MLKRIKPYLKYRYFLYFSSLVASWPCVFYLLGWIPDYKINSILLLILSAAFAISKGATNVPQTIKNIIMFQIFIWAVYAAIFFDTSYFTRIYCLLTTFFVLGLQVKYKNLEFIKTFNAWLVFQAVAGGIGFLLVTFGILRPIFEFIEMDGRPGVFYGLFTTNVFGSGLCRNAGFYDEPGALACWGMYALLFNKLFIDNKKVEKLLLFGLISTLSLAYFIQVPVYLYCFYKKNRARLILPVLLLGLSVYGLSMVNEEYNKAIFGRVEIDASTGQLAGDNRTYQTERALKVFVTSPIIGVGAKNLIEISKEVGFMGANIFGSWASDGLFGQIVIYMPLLLLFSYGRIKKKYLYAAIILALGFYQRPYGCVYLISPLVNFSLLMYAYFDIHKPEELRQADGSIHLSNY